MDELTVVNNKRRILWEPVPITTGLSIDTQAPFIITGGTKEDPDPSSTHDLSASTTVKSQPDQVLVLPEGSRLVVQAKRSYKKRSGNGHKSLKVRDLYDQERNDMQFGLFIPQNGMICDDDCLAYRQRMIDAGSWNPDIAIFQVTGFISVLHTMVAEGRLEVRDLSSYEAWMSSKYGGSLWARYNLSKYVAVREANQQALANGLAPTNRVGRIQNVQVRTIPRFTTLPSRSRFLRYAK